MIHSSARELDIPAASRKFLNAAAARVDPVDIPLSVERFLHVSWFCNTVYDSQRFGPTGCNYLPQIAMILDDDCNVPQGFVTCTTLKFSSIVRYQRTINSKFFFTIRTFDNHNLFF